MGSTGLMGRPFMVALGITGEWQRLAGGRMEEKERARTKGKEREKSMGPIKCQAPTEDAGVLLVPGRR